jgi:hypothetical protein
MEKWLRDTLAYLRPAVPSAFGSPPAPTADEVDAVAVRPGMRFWDSDQRQRGAWELPADAEGPLSDVIPRGHQQIGPSVAQGGIDVLAWYQPYHIYGDRWGIYLRLDGVAYVAFETLAAHGGSGLPRRHAVRAAMEGLLRHEESHFEVEVFATSLEMTLGDPIYLPYTRHFHGSGDFRREESLANRRIVHHHWDRPPLGGAPTRKAIEALADAGPRDYSCWRDYRSPKQFDAAKNTLAAEIAEGRYVGMATDPHRVCSTATAPPVPPRYAFYPGRQLSTPMWDRCHIPVYLVGLKSFPLWSHIFHVV